MTFEIMRRKEKKMFFMRHIAFARNYFFWDKPIWHWYSISIHLIVFYSKRIRAVATNKVAQHVYRNASKYTRTVLFFPLLFGVNWYHWNGSRFGVNTYGVELWRHVLVVIHTSLIGSKLRGDKLNWQINLCNKSDRQTDWQLFDFWLSL